jgi:hypothetical protein
MKRTLIFHCFRCHDNSITPVVWQDRGAQIEVACTKCGARYPFDPDRDRKHSDEAYFAYVRGYAERIGLDLSRAYSVLEGFASLDDARAAVRRIPGSSPPRQIGGVWAVTVVLAILVAIPIGYGWRIWSHEGGGAVLHNLPFVGTSASTDDGAASDRDAMPRASIRIDEFGAPTEVRARDPFKVLKAFCQIADLQERRVALGVMPAPPPNESMRLGVYVDSRDYAKTRAIRIFRDPRLRLWVARGDGRTPIDWIEVPEHTMVGRMSPMRQPEVAIDYLTD